MGIKSLSWVGRALRKAGNKILERNGTRGTWIDVGAHRGEDTLQFAIQNPGIKVYAFEPNLCVAAKSVGQASNYFVIPVAVAEQDGTADFYLNAEGVASSLLPLNESAAQSWIGGEELRVDSVLSVPTVRLDTFMNLLGIDKVDFLKIDAQGADLAVVRSAGERLKDILRVKLEVDVTPSRLYEGSPSREEVIAFMKAKGFVVSETQSQSHGQEQDLTFARPSGRNYRNDS